MGRFILRRFMMLIPVLSEYRRYFLIIQLAPGDPAQLMAALTQHNLILRC